MYKNIQLQYWFKLLISTSFYWDSIMFLKESHESKIVCFLKWLKSVRNIIFAYHISVFCIIFFIFIFF